MDLLTRERMIRRDERKTRRKFRAVMRTDRLDEYSLGAIIGLDLTPNLVVRAENRARIILEELKVWPTKNDVVLCDAPLTDAQGTPILDPAGNPELCGLMCKVSSENHGRIGFKWRCRGRHVLPGTRNSRDHNRRHRTRKYSVLKGTMCEGLKWGFRQLLKALYALFMDQRPVDTLYRTRGSPESVNTCFKFVREALAVVGWHDTTRIGGVGDIVEIDEVLLVKRKYNRGRIPVGQYWVFGGKSRASKKTFAMLVPDKTAITLEAEICDSIEPGSLICSDGWAAYNRIDQLRTSPIGVTMYPYHGVVIHNVNFVNPPRTMPPFWRDDILPECRDLQFVGTLPGPAQRGTLLPFRAHTQGVERSWRELGKFVKSSTNLQSVEFYIGCYCEVKSQS